MSIIAQIFVGDVSGINIQLDTPDVDEVDVYVIDAYDSIVMEAEAFAHKYVDGVTPFQENYPAPNVEIEDDK